MNTFTQWLFCLMFGFTIPTLSYAVVYAAQPVQLEQNSGKYEVLLRFPKPLKVGQNTYHLYLREGKIYRPLDVSSMRVVEKHLVTHPYSHWISAPVHLHEMRRPGEYQVATTFTKSGPWTIQVLPGANPKSRISDDIYFQVTVYQAG